jgi:hypothetical protein
LPPQDEHGGDIHDEPHDEDGPFSACPSPDYEASGDENEPSLGATEVIGQEQKRKT